MIEIGTVVNHWQHGRGEVVDVDHPDYPLVQFETGIRTISINNLTDEDNMPLSRHSEKPEEFRKIIESMYDHGRKLELFRRGKAPEGWDVDGNEAGC